MFQNVFQVRFCTEFFSNSELIQKFTIAFPLREKLLWILLLLREVQEKCKYCSVILSWVSTEKKNSENVLILWKTMISFQLFKRNSKPVP